MARRRTSALSIIAVGALVALGMSVPANARGHARELPAVGNAEILPSTSGTVAPAKRAAQITRITRQDREEAAAAHPYLSVDGYAEAKAAASGTQAATTVIASDSTRRDQQLSPSISTSFDGLSKESAANNGYDFSPPDTIVAKSPTHVLEAANSALRLFTNDGAAVQTVDLNTFFGAAHDNAHNGGLDLLFDPRVYYDRNAGNQRLYVVATQAYGSNDANGVSVLWFAVSRNADPSTLDPADWCTYGINAKRNAGTTKSSWLDYPTLGVGRDAILVGGNQFRFTNGTYTYPTVHVFNKNVAANNSSGCPNVPFFTFQPTTKVGSSTIFSLQPVQSYSQSSSFQGTRNPAYLLSTDIPASTSPRVHVWRIKNVASGRPTMTWRNVSGTFQYSIPPSAEQPGGTGVLMETGDTRLQGAVGRGNTLYGTLTTGCQIGSGSNESCLVYFRVAVGQFPNGALKASLTEELAWGQGDGSYVYHPSVAVNQASQVAVTSQASSANAADPAASYLGSIFLLKNEDAIGWITNAAVVGQCALPADGSNLARTGDYTGVQVDPADNLSFWMAGEYAMNFSGTCKWNTRVVKLTP